MTECRRLAGVRRRWWVIWLAGLVVGSAWGQGATVPYRSLVVLPVANETDSKRLVVWSLAWQILLQSRLRELPGIRVPELQTRPELIEQFAGGKLDVTTIAVRNQIAAELDADLLLAVTMLTGPPEWQLKAELIQPAVGPKPIFELPPITGEVPTVLVDTIVVAALKAALGVPDVTLAPYQPEPTAAQINQFASVYYLWPYRYPEDAQRGQLEKAVEQLTRLVRTPGGFWLTYWYYAQVMVAAGKGAEAAPVIQRWWGQRKREARANLLYGELLAALKRDSEAIPPLIEAANQSRGSLPAVDALAGCYKRTGKLDEAIAQYETASRNWPNVRPFHLSRGELALEARKFDVAMRAFRSAVQLNPAKPDAFRGLVASLMGLERHVEAYEAAKQWVGLAPDDLDALATLAVTGLKANDPAGVREAAEKVAKARPEDAKAQRTLGLVALGLNELEVAEQALAAAVKLDPKDVEAWRQLSNARLAADNLDGAAAALDEALKAAPDVERPQLQLDLALVQLYQTKYDEALANVEAAGQNLPTDPEPAYLKALILLYKDDPAAMVEAYAKALQLDPGAAGQGRQVIADVERMLESDAALHNAKLALGVLYEAAGRSRDARRRYREYLLAQPATPVRAYVEERIKALEAAGTP